MGLGRRALVERASALTEKPLCVGLGVSTGAQAAEVARYADGVIVGSAFVRRLLDAELPKRAGGRGSGARSRAGRRDSIGATGASGLSRSTPVRRRHRDGSRRQRPALAVDAARVALGCVLFFASYQKILEPTQAAAGRAGLPDSSAAGGRARRVRLATHRAGAGRDALLGSGPASVPVLAAGLMAVFIAGVISVWVRGLSIDCGCFGGGGAVPEGRRTTCPSCCVTASSSVSRSGSSSFP